MKKYILFFVMLMFISVAYADDCKWNDTIPCTTIYPKYTNNSNALGDKITPTKTITKAEIQKYNLIDLPKVLNYVQQHPDKVSMTEKQTRSGLKLLLRFGTIKSVPQALAALNPLHQATQK